MVGFAPLLRIIDIEGLDCVGKTTLRDTIVGRYGLTPIEEFPAEYDESIPLVDSQLAEMYENDHISSILKYAEDNIPLDRLGNTIRYYINNGTEFDLGELMMLNRYLQQKALDLDKIYIRDRGNLSTVVYNKTSPISLLISAVTVNARSIIYLTGDMDELLERCEDKVEDIFSGEAKMRQVEAEYERVLARNVEKAHMMLPPPSRIFKLDHKDKDLLDKVVGVINGL